MANAGCGKKNAHRFPYSSGSFAQPDSEFKQRGPIGFSENFRRRESGQRTWTFRTEFLTAGY
jgi:hypothetical protein